MTFRLNKKKNSFGVIHSNENQKIGSVLFHPLPQSRPHHLYPFHKNRERELAQQGTLESQPAPALWEDTGIPPRPPAIQFRNGRLRDRILLSRSRVLWPL